MQDIERLLESAESQAGRGLYLVLNKTLREIEVRLSGKEMPKDLLGRWRYLLMCFRPVKSSIQTINSIQESISKGEFKEAENLIKALHDSDVNLSLRYRGKTIGAILNEVERTLREKKKHADISQQSTDLTKW